MVSRQDSSTPDYRAMAQFRYEIRRFLRASEQIARTAGMKPQQYLLLLALKGLPEGVQPTIGELAERLQIQHHSTVELVDRLAGQGLVRRKRAGSDRRQVLLELTAKGEKSIRELALQHREELRNAGGSLVSSLKKILSDVDKPESGRRLKT